MLRTLRCGRFELPIGRPLIMGIVNITPDSFSGDGVVVLADSNVSMKRDPVEAAVARARLQWEAGADILDLGAESTRPGARPVSAAEELDRLLPVLEAVRGWNAPVSIDTYKPEVMQAALEAGADMVNDINALKSPGALEIVAASDCGLCLMHMQGEPRHMQEDPRYDDVVAEVGAFLDERVRACRQQGIADERLALDPGFGFGKNLEHNLTLFARLPELGREGLPLLVGLCRKRMLGEIIGRPVGERMAATLATTVLAAEKGAKIIRVHDVGATRDALAVWAAVRDAGKAARV
ncbi:MAG: dihydropteroate synthase [Zoogloeaceae bacterium]|jgi:dihydropteroate synthase|nr:dihydropteroate synthase [Zoogloeaceae bacterium]